MLMNMPNGKPGDSTVTFTRRLQTRLWVAVMLGIVGLFIVFVGWQMPVDTLSAEKDFMSGFMLGLGSGLLGGAIVTFIRTYRLLHNPEKLRDARIQCNDERLTAITTSAGRMAWMAGMGALMLASGTLALLGQFAPLITVLITMGALGLFFVIATIYYKIKM